MRSRALSRSNSRAKVGNSSPSPTPSMGKTMKLPMISNSPTFNSPSGDDLNLSQSHSSKTSLTSAGAVGICSMQGRRPYQEDEYALHPYLSSSSHNLPDTHFFGLFDGHAGGRCSQHVSQNLPNVLLEDEAFVSNLPQAIKRAFHTTNEQFLKIAEKMKLHDGSTGCVGLIRDNKLLVANAGDCRALVISGGRTIQMSNDHKPTLPDEQRRINSLGGSVVYCMGVARVNRILAVSRAFGNRTLRTVIKPDAELMQRDLTDSDEYLVIASDGLWDVLKNKDVADICYSPYLSRKPQAIADELVQTALSRGSMDNVTCIVVYLPEFRGKAVPGIFERSDSNRSLSLSTGNGSFTLNNNRFAFEEEPSDNNSQTHPPYGKKMAKVNSNNSLLDVQHKQHSLGSIDLSEIDQTSSPKRNTPPKNPLLKASTAPPNSLNNMIGSNRDLGLSPGSMVDDDNTTIIDFIDRPLTALEPLNNNLMMPSISNLPRVSASRGGGYGGSGTGIAMTTTAKTVSDVVGQQKASFPAHIRSLRNHGISSSFSETTHSNNNSSSPVVSPSPLQFKVNRPVALGGTSGSSWIDVARSDEPPNNVTNFSNNMNNLMNSSAYQPNSSLPPRSRGNSLVGNM